MTRKDYELIAQALRVARPSDGHWDNGADPWARQWGDTVTVIGNRLAEDNPRFDLFRFNAACGLTED